MSQCTPDFSEIDFSALDFQVTSGGFDFSFRTYLFNRLPTYFKTQDSYKDVNDKGLLERFMSSLGYELDYEVVSKIECYLSIIDASVCDEKYLIHLSDVLGNPPDVFQDENIYRNLLTYIVSIYKIKGTVEAYRLFFSILGFDIEITELPPAILSTEYDTGGIYDSGNPLAVYDRGGCTKCYLYDISFYPTGSGELVIDQSTLNKLKETIYFNQPINTRLNNLTSILNIEDSISINVTDEQKEKISTIIHYDGVALYDDGEVYDGTFDTPETPEEMGILLTASQVNTGIYRTKLYIDSALTTAIDTANSELTLTANNTENEQIYINNGGLLVGNSGGGPAGYAEYNIILNLHQINPPEANTFRVTGSIKTISGEKALIDITFTLYNDIASYLYFI